MPEVTLEQAAVVLGVSVDTVRRRIRHGQLTAHRDAGGRNLISVPSAPVLPTEVERVSRRDRERLLAVERENAHLLETLGELRRHLGHLEAHNATLRDQLALAGEAQRDLRRLLTQAQEHLGRLLPGAMNRQ